MPTKLLTSLAVAGSIFATAAAAQECVFEGDIFDLTHEQADALYDCVRDRLAEAYAAGGNEVATAYRGWRAAATGPALPGTHGERFLYSFVNDVGFDAYVQYIEDDESFQMPIGSVIAKESYNLRDGAPRLGPLFIMTRVTDAEAPDTDGWVYSAVQPNGQPMRFQQSSCHSCHVAFSGGDNLGYPVPEVRLAP